MNKLLHPLISLAILGLLIFAAPLMQDSAEQQASLSGGVSAQFAEPTNPGDNQEFLNIILRLLQNLNRQVKEIQNVLGIPGGGDTSPSSQGGTECKACIGGVVAAEGRDVPLPCATYGGYMEPFEFLRIGRIPGGVDTDCGGYFIGGGEPCGYSYGGGLISGSTNCPAKAPVCDRNLVETWPEYNLAKNKLLNDAEAKAKNACKCDVNMCTADSSCSYKKGSAKPALDGEGNEIEPVIYINVQRDSAGRCASIELSIFQDFEYDCTGICKEKPKPITPPPGTH